MVRHLPLPPRDRVGERRRAPAAGLVALAAFAIAVSGCSSSAPSTTAPPVASTAASTAPSSAPSTDGTTANRGSTGTTGAGPNSAGTNDAGGPTGTTGTAPRTTPPRSTAKITRFELPSNIACNGLTSIKATTTYGTTGATSVAFLVDNEQVGTDRIGTPPTSGSVELPLRCDGAAHTVVISAVDDQGRAAVMSRAVLTDDRQSGG